MSGDPCEAMHLLLQAELDGELDAASFITLEAHRRHCPNCTALGEELAATSRRIRAEATRHSAPASLRASLRPPPRRPSARGYWGHGGSFVAGMALAAGIAAIAFIPHGAGPVPEMVAAHIRALQPGHLTDVVSTDQHTVKPWFDGRLDYAPPVRDFAASGFPLIGGRLDYVAGRPVAVLVYRRGKHLIDVFVWPGTAADTVREAQGYNIAGWTQDGMAFRAVSDVGRGDLETFAALWRGDAVSPSPPQR